MNTDKGFNYPDRDDSPIVWPPRSEGHASAIAVWDEASLAWWVTGNSKVYGSARDLIVTYGNDWQSLS